MHVRKKWEFGKIRRLGDKYYGRYVCFQYISEPEKNSKIGLTVSRKYGNAIKRNIFKRRMREIFRQLNPEFSKSAHINILPLSAGKTATFAQLQTDWENFITYLGKGSLDENKT